MNLATSRPQRRDPNVADLSLPLIWVQLRSSCHMHTAVPSPSSAPMELAKLGRRWGLSPVSLGDKDWTAL
eukprot:CAMPEP_0204307262 /NCGR_PEP_ID=MMETSP0468-20130131/85842_1 /ASSEMBLY_ACC=CAM_ASM_000383 /TAXON_ID=2969 /ORGANISM="Oxyrrhis marina" /LENGTH=69 /DNA_ID=CAMNT_0051286617 /DNA_START=278 /DNA_END=487 /DNA_ORIENTATION=-